MRAAYTIRHHGKRYTVRWNEAHRLPLYQRLHIAATMASAMAWAALHHRKG